MIVSLIAVAVVVIVFTELENIRAARKHIRKLETLSSTELSDKERSLTQNRLERATEGLAIRVRLTWICAIGGTVLIAVALGITYVIDHPDASSEGPPVSYMPLVIGFGFIIGIGVSVICLAHAFARKSPPSPEAPFRHSRRTRAILAGAGATGSIGLTLGAIFYYVV